MPLPDIIAIDGPAASGKSTLAEKLAEHFGYLFFDTGVMYRVVTWAALKKLGSVENESEVSHLAEEIHIDVRPPSVQDERKYDVIVDGADVTWEIRQPEVEANVSQVSAYQGVRTEMTNQQRRISHRGGVVMVGRDIGTVVCPHARFKLFLEASVEERARRRFEEIRQRGETSSYNEILQSMKKRDRIDSTRSIAPLKPAEDAIILNSDGLGVEEIFQIVLGMISRLI
jgi:CMP/dCMP kinase